MNGELKKEIENAAYYCGWVNEWKYNSKVEKFLLSLLSVVKLLALEVDRLEAEKISYSKD